MFQQNAVLFYKDLILEVLYGNILEVLHAGLNASQYVVHFSGSWGQTN